MVENFIFDFKLKNLTGENPNSREIREISFSENHSSIYGPPSPKSRNSANVSRVFTP